MHPSDEIRGIKSKYLKNKKIILAITGSIASIETIKLSRELIRHGANIIPIMSKAATKIIHPDAIEFATGNKPIIELTGKAEHVSYCGRVKKSADLLLIAPCTSNTISKISHGIDDNIVTTFATTAIGSKIPIIIVPAMHISMYDHDIVQQNITKLKKIGIKFINPNIEKNKAKIANIEEITSFVIKTIGQNDLRNKKILIIGGSTEESIDAVRYISNRSSGKTALDFANNIYYRGGEVELWYGCSKERIPKYINTKYFTSIESLIEIVKSENTSKFDIIIVCAALSDYMIDKIQGKIRSNMDKLTLELKPSPKIIPILRKKSPNSIIIGFKLEEENKVIKKAMNLLKEYKLDFIIGNVFSAIDSDKNKIWLINKENKIIEINGKKNKITNEILDNVI